MLVCDAEKVEVKQIVEEETEASEVEVIEGSVAKVQEQVCTEVEVEEKTKSSRTEVNEKLDKQEESQASRVEVFEACVGREVCEEVHLSDEMESETVHPVEQSEIEVQDQDGEVESSEVDAQSKEQQCQQVELEDGKAAGEQPQEIESKVEELVDELPIKQTCQILKTLTDVEVNEKEMVYLQLCISEPRSVVWLKGDSVIENDEKFRICVSVSELNHSLTIVGIKPEHSDIYTAQIDDNDSGLLTSSCKVGVKGKFYAF